MMVMLECLSESNSGVMFTNLSRDSLNIKHEQLFITDMNERHTKNDGNFVEIAQRAVGNGRYVRCSHINLFFFPSFIGLFILIFYASNSFNCILFVFRIDTRLTPSRVNSFFITFFSFSLRFSFAHSLFSLRNTTYL